MTDEGIVQGPKDFCGGGGHFAPRSVYEKTNRLRAAKLPPQSLMPAARFPGTCSVVNTSVFMLTHRTRSLGRSRHLRPQCRRLPHHLVHNIRQ